MSDTVKVVKFFGETFRVNDSVSEFALMEFAEVAAEGGDADGMAGMAGLLRLVKECVDKQELPRFLKTARENRAKAEDLTPVLEACLGSKERPTGLSSVSSDGQPDIEAKSVASSDDKDSERLAGRPDLRQMIQQAKTA